MASPSSDLEIQRPPMVFRLLLAGVVVLAGLAVASPGGRTPEPGSAVACPVPVAEASGEGAPGLIVLPPGHPPIPGFGPHGRPVVTLPPGHPPVEGRLGGRPLPARPHSPTFEAPTTVDL